MAIKRQALSARNAPRRLNLTFYAVMWLLLDRWQPAGWVWGAVGCVCVIVFIVTLIDLFSAEDVRLEDFARKGSL